MWPISWNSIQTKYNKFGMEKSCCWWWWCLLPQPKLYRVVPELCSLLFRRKKLTDSKFSRKFMLRKNSFFYENITKNHWIWCATWICGQRMTDMGEKKHFSWWIFFCEFFLPFLNKTSVNFFFKRLSDSQAAGFFTSK